MDTFVINLWAGPGASKSTVASDLFALMKWQGKSVELVNEYAKELTWDKRHNVLSDQLYIMAKQNRKLERLRGQVEFVVTDSPLLMGLAYVSTNYYVGFGRLMRSVWQSYNNINFFLNRKKPYNPIGRNQSEEEARELDGQIKKIMVEYHVPFMEVDGTTDVKELILKAVDDYVEDWKTCG